MSTPGTEGSLRESAAPTTAPAPTPATSGGAPPPRACDADRHATVRVLQDALARGMLSFDEAGERMRAAYAARFVHDLPPLTADLPPGLPATTGAPGTGAPGWRRVWAVLLEQLRAEIALVSAGGLRAQRSRRAVAVALLLLVMLVTVGSLAMHGLSGGGPPAFRGGFGPEGFGRR